MVEKVAQACKKYGVGMGIYYSLWDRHQNGNVNDSSLDSAYNKYIVGQIKELIILVNKYTKPVELWLDAGWERTWSQWPIAEIYTTVKTLATSMPGRC